jgi:hypothetical protein
MGGLTVDVCATWTTTVVREELGQDLLGAAAATYLIVGCMLGSYAVRYN